MIRVDELKTWLNTLSDTEYVGIDDDCMGLQTESGNAHIDVGGISSEESDA